MEKEIKEITFGAKDSEMYKFEYTIPDGYEAEIKDGKVIVTKKESEDERIRKGLLEIFNKAQFGEWGKLKIKDIIAWLERQKEQKPAEWSEKDEKNIEKLDGFLSEVFCYGHVYVSQKDKEELQSWLKSLRPRPKHHDTYYDIIHNILGMLKGVDFTQITPEHRVSLLNDIRVKCKDADECAAILDEPHWKPSKEQMNALNAVANEGVLLDLFNDLLKLF